MLARIGFPSRPSGLAVALFLVGALGGSPLLAQQPSDQSASDVRAVAYAAALDRLPNPSASSAVGSSKPKFVWQGTTKDGVGTIFIGHSGSEESYGLKITGKLGGSGRDSLLSLDGLPAGGRAEFSVQRVFWNPEMNDELMDMACDAVLSADLSSGYATNAGGPYVGRVGEAVVLQANAPADLLVAGARFLWSFEDGVQAYGRSVTRTFEKAGLYQVKLSAKSADTSLTSSALIAIGKTAGPPVAGFIELLSPPTAADGDVRYRLSGVGSVAGQFRWDRGDGSVTDGIESPGFKYTLPQGGDPPRPMPRSFVVSVGKLESDGGVSVWSTTHVARPACSVMTVKHSKVARALVARAVKWGRPFFIGGNVGAGASKFAYADENQKRQEEALRDFSASATSALMFSPDLILRANWRIKHQYDAGDQADTCLPRLDSQTALICEDLYQKKPVASWSTVVDVSLQRSINEHFAIQPKVAYDGRKNAWVLSLPAYALQDSDGGLTGGIEVGWRSDTRAITAVFFLGALLDFGQ